MNILEFLNEIRKKISNLKKRRKSNFIIKKIIKNQPESNNTQIKNNITLPRIIFVNQTINAKKVSIAQAKVNCKTEKKVNSPRRSNPKKCPMCGTPESAYQNVILRENGHWKCAICGNTW